MDDRPIGVFDSGFGGLTVARALIDLLPDERLVYLGDTARYPYGSRPLDEVRAFAVQITERLVDGLGAKMVVVACNTAAAAALDELRESFAVPIVGVIEPGVRSLLEVSVTGRVGVIGTVGTIASGAYQQAVADVDPDCDLTCAACPGFVEFVERGEVESDQVHVLAERLLAPVREARVDALLLGCTHYPYLARTIGDVMGRGVVLVSSADETAFAVRRMLEAAWRPRRARGQRHHPPLLVVGRYGVVHGPGAALPRARARTRRELPLGLIVGVDALSVTVLGCSGTYAAAGVPCTGFLVRGGGVSVWLDCGPGTLANLQHHVALDELDAVVVTHCHPDHWLELPVLYNACRYGIERLGLPVFTTAETRHLLEVVVDDHAGPTFDLAVIDEDSTFAVGSQRWRFSLTDHPVQTLAPLVAVDAGRFAFSADTGPDWGFERFDEPIDLAVCESTVLDAERRPDLPHLERAARRRAGSPSRRRAPRVDPPRSRAGPRSAPRRGRERLRCSGRGRRGR